VIVTWTGVALLYAVGIYLAVCAFFALVEWVEEWRFRRRWRRVFDWLLRQSRRERGET
jgi:hypothetical protein